MSDKKENRYGEMIMRNLVIIVSLVLTIVTFLIFSSLPADSTHGDVSTTIFAVRPGSVENTTTPFVPEKNSPVKTVEKSIMP